MEALKKFSSLVGKYMAVIIIVVAAIALFFPEPTKAIFKTSYINTLLGIIMFGMGLTLRAHDFVVVFTKPKSVIVGILAQFIIMPSLAFVLVKIFNLPPELAIGVILVGTCPGGTSSNVITYLSKGDVALSVGITSCTTILAPIVTPLLTLLFAGQGINVNGWGMFLSIVQVVIVPIVVGIIVNRLFGKFAQDLVTVLPVISIAGISAIVAAVVAANSAKIMSVGVTIMLVVILHNVLGYLLGLGAAKLFKFNPAQCRAISIEVGMQNSGLATSLATTHFAAYPLAAVPGAMFSVWHNVSGAIMANIYSASFKKDEAKAEAEARAEAAEK